MILAAGLKTGFNAVRDRLWFRIAAGLCVLLCLIVVLDRCFPPPLDQVQTGQVVRDRFGRVLRAYPVEDGRWRLVANLDEIDPDFVDALLAYEDQRFYSHRGVDLTAIVRASRDAVQAGRVVSGASTITMQTARLLEPRPRNLGSKLVEMIRAVQLETRLSKREILELYLTLAPYGGNLEGVRAASWAYFGREPDELTLEQTAMLIALPQSPEARRPDLRPEAAILARGRVLDRLAVAGLASTRAARDASLDPAPIRRDFPDQAWQAADSWRARFSHVSDIRSSLDGELQQALETLLAAETPPNAPDVQLSLIVVDTRTMAVRALVGAADRSRAGGWLDLTHRARSPGSTLKPFIYAMAFDDGLASGQTRIADLPTRFAGYRPDNFDRRFRGDVTIAEALQHSLNVPAVSALDQVGARRFNAALGFAGALPERRQGAGEDSGLAVALGGAGLTSRQLAVLYAALDNEGVARPLRWRDEDPETEQGYGLVTAESATEILDILRRAPHPGGRAPAHLTRSAPQIAFKTGTSYGFRDAWAAGVSGGFAVIVWSGRADGVPRPGVTGREGALPVLFRVFDQISAIMPDYAPERDREEVDSFTPQTLARFARETAPHILFPPHESEVWMGETGHTFILAARADGDVRWFADGDPLDLDLAGDALWQPPGPGFYEIRVVDSQGRESLSRVRVLMPG